MERPLISVIVPVFRVEQYLPTCVDSILAQTYENLEVILVDDGSDDGSPAICDQYAQKDSRVVVIHQKNGGLSNARNTGLQAARGAYIGFVDSDDAIAPDLYEHLYTIAKTHQADISMCRYINWDGGAFPTETAPEGTVRVYPREESLRRYLRADGPDSFFEVWDRLYDRKVLENIRFTEGVINEDVDFGYRALLESRRICMSPAEKYYYNVGNVSITRNAIRPKDHDLYKTWGNVVAIAKERDPENLAFAQVNYHRVAFTLLLKYAMFGIQGFEDPKQEIRWLQAQLRAHKGELLRSKGLTSARKIAVVLLCWSVPLVKWLFDRNIIPKQL